MLRFVLASCGLLVACASLYGWGMAVRRFAHAEGGSRPVTMALGLAALLPIGGLLNLIRFATPVALWLVVGVGLLLFEPAPERTTGGGGHAHRPRKRGS